MVRTVQCPSLANFQGTSPRRGKIEETFHRGLPCLFVEAGGVEKDQGEGVGVVSVGLESRNPVPLRCDVQRIVRLRFKGERLAEHDCPSPQRFNDIRRILIFGKLEAGMADLGLGFLRARRP